MRPADAFFWYAEAATPELRPLVAGVFVLDRVPDPVRLRAAISHMSLAIPRLRRRVVEPLLPIGLPTWVDDADFELDYHLRAVDLPAPGSWRQLLRFGGEVFSAPIDHLRPLWEAHLIGGLADGRAALLLKLHHAVMDGVGSMVLLDALTQARRGDRVTALRRPSARNGASPADGMTPGLRRAVAAAVDGLGAAAQALGDPGAVLHQLAGAARSARSLIGDLASSLNAAPIGAHCAGIGRRLDAVPLSLPRLRRIKTALGVTLNDLILLAVTGALSRYHARRGPDVQSLQCIVPMSLRQDHDRPRHGNRVGGFTVTLPVGEPDPAARLALIRAQTTHAKGSGQGTATALMMQAAALVPSALFRAAAHGVAGRVHLICSNVPGPPARRYLAGARIDAVYPFAPVMAGTPLSIALLSYGDSVCVGIDTDPAAIPDPERLGRYLQREVDALEVLVRRRPRHGTS